MTRNKILLIEWGAKIVALFILLYHCLQTFGLFTPNATETMFNDRIKFLIVEIIILLILMICLGLLSWYFKERQFLLTSLYPLTVLIVVALIIIVELPYLNEVVF